MVNASEKYHLHIHRHLHLSVEQNPSVTMRGLSFTWGHTVDWELYIHFQWCIALRICAFTFKFVVFKFNFANEFRQIQRYQPGLEPGTSSFVVRFSNHLTWLSFVNKRSKIKKGSRYIYFPPTDTRIHKIDFG